MLNCQQLHWKQLHIDVEKHMLGINPLGSLN